MSLKHEKIIGIRVDSTSYNRVVELIDKWIAEEIGRQIIPANVHVLMEAVDKDDFREIIESADIVTPDGMPLVWMLRLKGSPEQERVYGPTMMLKILQYAQDNNIAVGLYGGKPDVLETLCKRLQVQFSGLKLVFTHSPPFRILTIDEENKIIQEIIESGLRILFVGLGCPKQERWIAANIKSIPAVMIGVGAAFDFLAGTIPQAPKWMQNFGLEWLFRLIKEPGRLWKRYLYYNPRFILKAIVDLM